MSDAFVYDMTDTWNDAGTTFTAVKMNVTNTASNANSNLILAQIDGADKFKVRADGSLFVGAHLIAGSSDLIYNNANTQNFDLSATVDGDAAAASWSGTFGVGRIVLGGGVGLQRDADHVLAQRSFASSTSPQAYRIYNTWTDGSNYERGAIDWTTRANALTISTQAAGTGVGRDIDIKAAGLLNLTGTGGTVDIFAVATRYSFQNLSNGFFCVSGAAPLGLSSFPWGNITTSGYIDIGEIAAPANPAANIARLYSRDEAGVTKLAFRDSAGTETVLGAGGGGGGSPGGSSTQLQFNNAGAFGGVAGSAVGTDGDITINQVTGAVSTSPLKVQYAGVGIFSVGYQGNVIINASGSLAASIGVNISGNINLFGEAANIFSQRSGTSPQAHRTYNTYTDGSNYERGVFDWLQTANVLTIGAEAAGTGVGRAVYLKSSNTNKDIYLSSPTAHRTQMILGHDGNDPIIQNSTVPATAGHFRVRNNGSAGVMFVEANSGAITLAVSSIASNFISFDVNVTTPGGNSQVWDHTGTRRLGIGLVNYAADMYIANTGRPTIDEVKYDLWITGSAARPTATVNLSGGHIRIAPGQGASSSAGAAHGGSLYLDGGQGFGTGSHGNVVVGSTRGNLVVSSNIVCTGTLTAKMPSFRAYRSANQLAVPSGSWTRVQCNVEEFDSNSNYDKDTNFRFLPTVAGKYLVNVKCAIATFNTLSQFYLAIYKNGTAFTMTSVRNYAASATWTAGVFTAVISLNGSTDYIEFWVNQGSGSNKDLVGDSGLEGVEFSATWQGP